MSFRIKMEKAAKEKGSNIVLALDFPFEKPENRQSLYLKAEKVLEAVQPHICAVKINHHLLLPLGLFDGVQKLLNKAHDFGLLTIVDCKANDIGSTNEIIAQYYYEAGFDALIANPFVGWDEGLKPIFDIAQKMQRGVILLVYMSHKGAYEGYGQTIMEDEENRKIQQYMAFARKALKWKADGVIVGATYPEKIREVYQILGKEVPIYSPGVGAQGGEIKSALEAGASYLIVGRAITSADDPAKTAEEIKKQAREIRF
ncbi:MAG: orotidine 5'-phosphate decarboxylase [Candidatus Bathyarchaeia archaeon]